MTTPAVRSAFPAAALAAVLAACGEGGASARAEEAQSTAGRVYTSETEHVSRWSGGSRGGAAGPGDVPDPGGSEVRQSARVADAAGGARVVPVVTDTQAAPVSRESRSAAPSPPAPGAGRAGAVPKEPPRADPPSRVPTTPGKGRGQGSPRLPPRPDTVAPVPFPAAPPAAGAGPRDTVRIPAEPVPAPGAPGTRPLEDTLRMPPVRPVQDTMRVPSRPVEPVIPGR